MHLFHLLIVIIQLMVSDYLCPNVVIILSGAYCNKNPTLNCDKDFLIVCVKQIIHILNETMAYVLPRKLSRVGAT
jgi:hypothetical protein